MCGIGFGCFQSPNNREMLSNVAREYASYASGVLSIVRTFGQCLGAAVVEFCWLRPQGQIIKCWMTVLFIMRCGSR